MFQEKLSDKLALPYVFINSFSVVLKILIAIIFLPTITLENFVPSVNKTGEIALNSNILPDVYVNFFSNVITSIYILIIASIVTNFLIIWNSPFVRAMWFSLIINLMINICTLLIILSLLFSNKDYRKKYNYRIGIYIVIEITILMFQSIYSILLVCIGGPQEFLKPYYQRYNKLKIIPSNTVIISHKV